MLDGDRLLPWRQREKAALLARFGSVARIRRPGPVRPRGLRHPGLVLNRDWGFRLQEPEGPSQDVPPAA
jgi:hypothetical protein